MKTPVKSDMVPLGYHYAPIKIDGNSLSSMTVKKWVMDKIQRRCLIYQGHNKEMDNAEIFIIIQKPS